MGENGRFVRLLEMYPQQRTIIWSGATHHPVDTRAVDTRAGWASVGNDGMQNGATPTRFGEKDRLRGGRKYAVDYKQATPKDTVIK